MEANSEKLKEKDEKYEQEKKEYEKTKEKNVALIKKLYDYVSLPKDDEKYPSEKIKEIEDKEYIMKLQKHSDQIIKVVAANFFREMKKKEMGIEEDSKKILFDAINARLTAPREKYEYLMSHTSELDEILSTGAARAREIADKTIKRVMHAMIG